MAKARLMLGLLASTAWLPLTTEAQMLLEPPHGSVLFPPSVSTYYYNPGFADTDLFEPEGSGEGAVSFWYNSTTPPPRDAETFVIEELGSSTSSFENFSVSFYYTYRQTGIANGYRLRVVLHDGTGATVNYCIKTSNPLLVFNGTWQPITLKWNTNVAPNEISATIGGAVVSWEPALGEGCTGAFKAVYQNAPWTIGATLAHGAPTDFYHGMLAELFGHFQDGDWNDLSMRGSALRGTALRTTVKPHDTASNIVVPLDLGVDCQNVFGLPGNKLLPAICMRGDSMNFPVNHDGDSRFVVPMGFLPPTDGLSDPFDLR